MKWTQQDAPLMDALKEHLLNRVVRFDVPGHKGGRGNQELADFLGDRCVQIDVNSMKTWTISVIRYRCFGMPRCSQRRLSALPTPFSSSTAQPVLPRR